MNDPTWTDITSVGILGAQLLILAIAAGVAGWQAGEARRLRLEQHRPFVVIDFEREEETRAIYLTISNLGTSLARDVRFDVTPPFRTAIDLVPFAELKMFKDGISSLAPGKTIRTLFDVSTERYPRRGELPDEYEVRVRYFDEQRKRSFDEQQDLDLGIYWDFVHITRYGIHDIHERVKEIRNELKKWTASGGGLLQLSRQDAKDRDAEILQSLKEQADRERQQHAEAKA